MNYYKSFEDLETIEDPRAYWDELEAIESREEEIRLEAQEELSVTNNI